MRPRHRKTRSRKTMFPPSAKRRRQGQMRRRPMSLGATRQKGRPTNPSGCPLLEADSTRKTWFVRTFADCNKGLDVVTAHATKFYSYTLNILGATFDRSSLVTRSCQPRRGSKSSASMGAPVVISMSLCPETKRRYAHCATTHVTEQMGNHWRCVVIIMYL